MDTCYFCASIKDRQGLSFIEELETGLFAIAFDGFPTTPGHTLIIPKRHVQYMADLTHAEQSALVPLSLSTKQYLKNHDLKAIYRNLLETVRGNKTEAFVQRAFDRATQTNRPPDAFNDGVNDGAAAGQTVPHFHWHVMPRWEGDVADPRGGIRHTFSGLGNYHEGIK